MLLAYFFQFHTRQFFMSQYKSKTKVRFAALRAKVETFLAEYKTSDFIPKFEMVPQIASYGAADDDNETRGGTGGGGGRGDDRRRGQGQQAPGTNLRYLNPHPDPRFVGDFPYATTVKQGNIKANKQRLLELTPPVTCPVANGRERCLSWHIKGFCY